MKHLDERAMRMRDVRAFRPSRPPPVLTAAACLAFPAIVYAMTFLPIMRPLGEVPLLIVAAFAAGSIVLMGHVIAPRSQWALIVISTIWLCLSFARLLPPSWTIYFDSYAAIRQWAWTLLIPIFVTSFYAFWLRFGSFVIRHALILATIYLFLARAATLTSGQDYNIGEGQNHIFQFYGVDNANMPVLLLLGVFSLRSRRPLLIDVAIVAPVIVLCTSSTNFVVALALIGIKFTPAFRWAPASLGVALVMALLISPNFAPEIFQFDNNAGLRALMWKDASTAVLETHGLGVGYGTEYFKNEWVGMRDDTGWLLTEEYSDDRLVISTHSAFYDIALRLGLAGLALFMLWMGSFARIPRLADERRARMYAFVVCMLYVSISFNPGIVSVNLFVGVSMLIAFAEWIRRRAVSANHLAAPP